MRDRSILSPGGATRRPSAKAAVVAVVGAAVLGAAPVATAQTPTGLGGFATPPAAGYIGLSLGKAGFDPECRAGFGCDKRANAYKVALGALGADIWGVEVAYVDLGKVDASGGSQKASAFSLSGIGTLPITPAFSVLAKLGLSYARTRTSAAVTGIATGSENGFGPSYGVGLAYAFDPRLSVVAEYEGHRIKFAPGRQTVDLLSIGIRYRY